jgi:hypothetical protein
LTTIFLTNPRGALRALPQATCICGNLTGFKRNYSRWLVSAELLDARTAASKSQNVAMAHMT